MWRGSTRRQRRSTYWRWSVKSNSAPKCSSRILRRISHRRQPHGTHPLLDTKDDLPPTAARLRRHRGEPGTHRRALPRAAAQPGTGERIAHTGSYVRFESSLPGDVRELAIISVARTLDCRFEWAAHSAIARNEGVREKPSTRSGGKADGLDEVEREVWTYTNQLLDRHRASDEAFAAVESATGRRALSTSPGRLATTA
ncbi:MAG: carboxymuconolactone decarboxylase family protein [Dehalococcoidia bacterium]|nr:carboxymuconolactone decarboxylase family protein [Dehalococcoidia bacterium]